MVLLFLYYVLLIPFTFLGDLVLGAKIASLFFLSAMTAVFYMVLKNLKLRYSFFGFLFLLASSGYFLFRMNLARPLNFSVIFLLLIFYALIKKNNLLLFIISFLYVWAHGSFPLAIFLTLAFVAVNYVYSKRIYYRTIIASLGGTILAVLINPFFPNNINYFTIYYLNSTPYQLTAQIMEWQPISIYQIFYDAPVLLISFLILLIVFCVKFILEIINKGKLKSAQKLENKIITSFLFIISITFFIGMLLQGRFIDYWVPFSIIFIAFYAESLYFKYFKNDSLDDLKNKLKLPDFFSAENVKICGTSVLAVIIVFSIWSRANFVLGMMGTDESNKNIRETSLWLKSNTPEKSIVFNANWGDFSKMFFYNAHNYYVLGLDAKFMYVLSPEKYWFYAHLSDGVICDREECNENKNNSNLSVHDVLKNEFNADYVFVPLKYNDFDYANLINILNSDSRFEKMYENEGGEVWKVK